MCATIRVWNPYREENPRRKKALSREQAEKHQAKAVRFASDVLGNAELADELESLTVREYAERKGFELINNPTQKGKKVIPMKKDELKQLVKDGVIEAFKETRRLNPNGQQAPTDSTGKGKSPDRGREQILDEVDDAAAALADGDEDEALDLLNGILDRYSE